MPNRAEKIQRKLRKVRENSMFRKMVMEEVIRVTKIKETMREETKTMITTNKVTMVTMDIIEIMEIMETMVTKETPIKVEITPINNKIEVTLKRVTNKDINIEDYHGDCLETVKIKNLKLKATLKTPIKTTAVNK